MIASIEIPVAFMDHPMFPARKNCDDCDFFAHGLCTPKITGIQERCQYGQRGYWVFRSNPEGGLKIDWDPEVEE